MKRAIAFFILVFLFPVSAHAKILDRRTHRQWDSFVLLDDKLVAPRMLTHGVDDMAGSFVRFKIDLPNTAPVYKRYSLAGFTAAYQRMMIMCREIEEILNNRKEKDSDYFNERQIPQVPKSSPTPAKDNKNDSDFFI